MRDEMYRDDLTVEETEMVMDNMRKASDRAQVIAGFWFYLTIAIAVLLVNKWLAIGSLVFAARIIWIRWRDRWVRA